MPSSPIALPTEPGQRLADVRALQDRHLPWIGAALALMVFAAFTPTYFVPVAAGQFDRPAFLHVHGGLSGAYRFELTWDPNSGSVNRADGDRASLFTALREQLGLRLDSRKGPVEFLVIDSAERPVED
jgi:uncharacterized protein (TIGR03435 family)